jgi:hypothetical protein
MIVTLLVAVLYTSAITVAPLGAMSVASASQEFFEHLGFV